MLSPKLDSVREWIRRLSHPFWDYHFSLASRPAPRPVHLLGDGRVNDILANVIQPILIAGDHADWDFYMKIRAESDNRRLAVVCKRLFGETDHCRKHLRFLYQQQGLLQIFEDFCLADTTNCAACRFPELVEKFKTPEQR